MTPDRPRQVSTPEYEGPDRRRVPATMSAWAATNSHILGYLIAGVVFGTTYLVGSATVNRTSDFAREIQESRLVTTAALCEQLDRRFIEVNHRFPQERGQVIRLLNCEALVEAARITGPSDGEEQLP